MTISTSPQRSTFDASAWYSGEQRWTQLTFVEDDPLHFDLEYWTDVIERTSSTAVCISAGGYMAFYPTSIPLHYRSKHLGDRDLLGEVIDVAKSRGLAVMARIDPHAVHRDVREAHPEWIARTEDGRFQEHWALPGIYVTDAYGGYNWEFMTDVAREITADYDVDAIFANRWQGHGPAYTENSRRLFREAHGHELPTSADPADGELWRAYHQWRREHLSDLVAHWDAEVQAVKPSVRFIPNLGSFAASELSDRIVRNHVPFFLVDHQARGEGEVQWSAGRDAKRTRATYPDKPVGLITSVGPESHGYRWKDSVNAEAETVSWIVDGFVHGAFPWFTKFAARIHDHRWAPAVERAFSLHKAVVPLWQDAAPAPEVCVWDIEKSQATARLRRASDGIYQALVELRVPFEYVNDRGRNRLDDARTRLLIMPEIPNVTADAARDIRAFVDRGGHLLVTGSGPEVDDGSRLLDDLIGAELIEWRDGVVRNNYVARVPDGDLQVGFEAASRIIGGTRLARFAVPNDADVAWRFVPDHPDLPMEEVYPRGEPVEAAVFTASAGHGKVTVAAFNLSEIFADALLEDHLALIGNVVRAGLGGETAVTLSGSGLLDCASWATAASFTFAFANLTGPMAMRGQQRDVWPLDDLHVAIALQRLNPDVARALPEGSLRITVLDGDELRQVDAELLDDGRLRVNLPTTRELGVVNLAW